MNSKLFWIYSPKLLSLIDQQSLAIINQDDEAYEQCSLDIEETVDQLLIILEGDSQYDIAKEIFG